MSRSLFGLWRSLGADRKTTRVKAQQEQRRARKALFEPLEQRAMMAVFGIELISDAREVWNMQPGSVPTVQGRFRVYRDSAGAAATHGIYFNINQGAGLTSGDGNLSGNVSPALTLNATASTNNPQYVSVTFAAGLNYSDIVFTPTDDSAWEFEEYLTVRINDFGTYTVDNSKRQATMRLEDWDRPHVVNMQAITSSPTFSSFWPGLDAINSGDPNMSLYRQTATISEGQSATVYFDRMAQSTAEETRFRFQVSGGAVANSDFTLSGANLVSFNAATGIGVAKFPVGATSTSLTYTATSDGFIEARESTLFTLLPSDNVSQFHKYWVSGHVPSQTTTIEIVGQGAAIPTFGIEKISDAAEAWNLHGVPATAGKFRIYRDTAGPEAIYNLNITATPSAGLTGVDGTAWPVLVHNAVPANHYITVYFAAGATYSDITYNPTDDSEWEFDESLTVVINAWPGVYNLDPAKTAATMAVVDWDRPHVVNMQAIVGGVSSFAPGWDAINSGDPNVATYKQVATVSEGQSATIYFDRMGVNAGAQETRFRFQVTSTTVSTSDFSLSGANLVSYDSLTGIGIAKYSVGSTNTSFTLTANADGLNEARESLTITLLPSDGASQFHQYTRSGHIPSLTTTIDIVGPGATLPTFGIEKISDAVEFWNYNNTPAVPGKLRVHRDIAGPAATYNLNITATPSAGMTSADGTAWPVLVHSAVAANHYITVNFPAGVTYVDITYNPTDDTTWEYDEAIAVTLNPWSGVYNLDPAKSSAVLTLIDADRPVVWMRATTDGGYDTNAAIAAAINSGDPNASSMTQVATIVEGTGATINFSRIATAQAQSNVRFQISGAGIYQTDFTLTGPNLISFDPQTNIGVVRISAGSWDSFLDFDAIGDGAAEGTERVTFTILPAESPTPYSVTGFAPHKSLSLDIIDKPNLSLSSFVGDGQAWKVTYDVAQSVPSQPITIHFYSTYDGVTPAVLLGSTVRSAIGDLSIGTHTVSVPASFSDPWKTDYHLMAVIDPGSVTSESSEADNARIFDGGIFRNDYFGNQSLHVQGTAGEDEVLVSKEGSGTRVRMSFTTTSPPVGDVSGDSSLSQLDVDILTYNIGATGVSLWQNPTQFLDVDGDSTVSPVDALIIINQINLVGPHFLPAAGPGAGQHFLDVDGDHAVTESDANRIIGYLNGYSSGPPVNPALDVDASGVVDGADLAALYAAWDATPYSALIPSGVVNIRLNDGDDSIVVSADVSTRIIAYGGAGNDTIIGGNGHDILFGGGGNDALEGKGGGDELWGDAGEDWLNGGEGSDLLYGGDNDDHLIGSSGDDTLNGQDGIDFQYGGDGNDYFVDYYGNDRSWGEIGDDTITLPATGGYWNDDFGTNTVYRNGVASTVSADPPPAVPPANASNLLVNGGFEHYPVRHSADWYLFSSIPGWTLSSYNVGVELHKNKIVTAREGLQYVELDGDIQGPDGVGEDDERTATTIYQDITTASGVNYSLQFSIAAREANNTADSSITVSLLYADSGEAFLVQTFTPTGSGWDDKAIAFTGTGSSVRVMFSYAGTPIDSKGAFLDAVSVRTWQVDLMLDANNDAAVDDLDTATEDQSPGKILSVTDSTRGELKLNAPSAIPSGWAVRLEVLGDADFRIWNAAVGGAVVTELQWESGSSVPSALFLEALTGGELSARLSLVNSVGTEVVFDTAQLTLATFSGIAAELWDGTWAAKDADEAVLDTDHLRFTSQGLPNSIYQFASDVEWTAYANSLAIPGQASSIYLGSSPLLAAHRASLPIGEWTVSPEVTLTSGIVISFVQASGARRGVDAAVHAVTLVSKAIDEGVSNFVPNGTPADLGGGHAMFPEKRKPGEREQSQAYKDFYNTLGLAVFIDRPLVAPQGLGIRLSILDPDHYSDDVGFDPNGDSGDDNLGYPEIENGEQVDGEDAAHLLVKEPTQGKWVKDPQQLRTIVKFDSATPTAIFGTTSRPYVEVRMVFEEPIPTNNYLPVVARPSTDVQIADDGRTAEKEQPEGFVPVLTRENTGIISIWRTLHVEVDAMSAPDLTVGEFIAEGSIVPGSIDGRSFKIDQAVADEESLRFKGGRITLLNDDDTEYGTFEIGSSTHGAQPIIRVLSPDPIPASVTKFKNLVDDDWVNPLTEELEPDLTLLNSRLRAAFIKVDTERADLAKNDDSNVNGSIPFQLHLGETVRTAEDFIDAVDAIPRQSTSEAEFWVVQLIGAFQGPKYEDGDYIYRNEFGNLPPQGAHNVHTLGIATSQFLDPTTGSGGGRAIIFRETIRDLSEQQQPGVGTPETVLAALTTVHEVGHLFMLDHDPSMGPIMMIEQIKSAPDQAAQDAVVFSGAGLRKIIVQYEPRGVREIND